MKPWVQMWVIACALYFFFKIRFFPRDSDLTTKIIFLFAWPGMDAKALRRGAPQASAPSEWIYAVFKTSLGLALLWIFPRYLPSWAQGWSGMLGLIFVLHFGIFHILAITLLARGYGVQRIMKSPLFATSVADFWGKRWNMAFRDLAHADIFRRLSGHLGGSGAILATFLFSGLVHEAVISFPVRAGLGRPTLYFLIQGFAILVERRLGTSRIFTLAVVLLFAPLLFHPPFLNGVIVPFLHAIGGMP